MKRRDFIYIGGLGLLGAFSGVNPVALPGSRRPNIILFLVDDLGWQDTSEAFYKERTPFNKRYHTPNIERLSHEGVKFTQAYACAVCSPSRVSLMTGMNSARHRVTNWTLYKNKAQDGSDERLQLPEWNVNGMSAAPGIERTVYVTPLPMLLHNAGYTTIHCGKAHFGAIDTPGADPLNLGFDINIAGHAAGGPGSYDGLANFGNGGIGEHTLPWGVPGLEKYHGKDISLTEALTLEAISALDRSLKNDKPFFLYMAHYAVHVPLEPDKRFIKPYRDAGIDEKEARYCSMVEAMDKSLGDLMDYVKTRGIEKDTVIMFMSDNGGLSAQGRGGTPHTHNKPLASGKGSAYEGGIREPMVVKWPGFAQSGSVCDSYLIIEDFFPTILEIADIRKYSAVQNVDGVSFVPLLRGKSPVNPDRPLFWHYPNNWGPKGPGIGATSTIRKGDWKLIYYHADRKLELFNIREDIGETTDLSKSDPERVRRLAVLLTQHLKSVNAQMPVDRSTGKMVPYPVDVL